MDKIAVLIPCYNESQTIAKVVEDCRRALPEAVIYVYDNNSQDDSAALARRAGAIVRHEHAQGKGRVIRSMFRDIDALCYVMLDADDTYPCQYAREMADMVLSGLADMVLGDRLSLDYFAQNKRPFHGLGNRLVRYLIRALFKTPVSDIMTGYRAFSYPFVKTFPALTGGFEIETEMTIHALDKNLTLRCVAVPYKNRPQGSKSKLNTYTDGAKVLRTIFRLFKNYRPFAFFGLAACLLALLALLFFTPVFISYLKTGLVERFPTLIVSAFVMLSAVHCFFGGLILDVLAQGKRRDFEIQVNLCHQMLKQALKKE